MYFNLPIKLQEMENIALLLDKNTPLLVGVSGGVDSMVLLALLQKQGFNIQAIHINYQLREMASDLDEQLVEDFCTKNNIPLVIKRAKYEGGNLQNWAREFRYNCFTKYGKHVALAHHADDQLETIFMNLFRGTGIDGWTGMKEKTSRNELTIYRPLLKFKKADLYDYAIQHQIPFREDLSNKSIKYKRNKIRNQLIPFIETHFGTQSLNNLLASTQLLQQQKDLLKILINPYLQESVVFIESEVHILLTPFNGYLYSLKAEILKSVLAHRLSINQERLARIIALCDLENGKKLYYNDIEFLKQKDKLVIRL